MTADAPEATETELAIARSPADILRVVVAVVVLLVFLLVEALFGAGIDEFTVDLLRGLDRLGSEIITFVALFTRVLALGFLGGGLVYAVMRGTWRLLGTVVLAGALGAGLFLLTENLLPEPTQALIQLQDKFGFLGDTGFPSGWGTAAVTAIVASATPWIGRRQRRIGWALVLLLAAVRLVAHPLAADSMLAVLAGWVAGSVAVAALGAPTMRATRHTVMDGLRHIGIDLVELEPAAVDARGSTPYFGTTASGDKLFVKALGRDERDADLLFRLYRYILPHNLGDERPFSSLRRAVEHEALVALAANSYGVRTPNIAGMATVEPDSFVLAYVAVAGRSLDRLEPDEITDDIVDQIWTQLAILRTHRIAHRDLRLANVFVADDAVVWMIDFGFSELAASDQLLATDLAEITASLALKIGLDRAVAGARRGVGDTALTTAADRLKPAFLSGATRTGMKESPGLLDQLRDTISSLAGP